MDKELQFAKTQEKLVEKVGQIIRSETYPKYVRDAFKSWLEWFAFLNKKIKSNVFRDLTNESAKFYRAFVIPSENFYAIQVWERHPNRPLARCVETLYANKVNPTNWTENVIDNRKRA